MPGVHAKTQRSINLFSFLGIKYGISLAMKIIIFEENPKLVIDSLKVHHRKRKVINHGEGTPFELSKNAYLFT